MSILEELQKLLEEKSLVEAPERVREKLAAAPKEASASAKVEPAPTSAIDLLIAISQTKNPGHYSEIRRICDLTIVPDLTEEEVEQISRDTLDSAAIFRGIRLFPVQARAIKAWRDSQMLFAPIGVGFGKTLLTAVVASDAIRNFQMRRVLLVMPSPVFPQFVNHQLPLIRSWLSLGINFHLMGGITAAKRKMIAGSGNRGCYVLPSSCFSTRDTSDILDTMQPQLIIIDECHHFKSKTSGRTKRLMRYLRDHPDTKVVCLSGTVTQKGVRDFHHLLDVCLQEGSPLPRHVHQAIGWGQSIDANASPSAKQTGPLMPLMRWAVNHGYKVPGGVSGFRKSFQHRMACSPGVAASADAEIGTSLTISNQVAVYTEGGEQLLHMIERLQTEWVTPNGDLLEHAIHTYKWNYELSCGFYNHLQWPEPEDTQHGIQILAAQAHHKAGQIFNKAMKDFFKLGHKKVLDTPLLVRGELARNGSKNLPAILYKLWVEMKKLEFPDMPERISTVTRVCDYKIAAAAKWAEDLDKGGIIWVQRIEAGLWLREYLPDAAYAPGGANDEIADPKNRDKIFIASLDAHSTGKNLQHFQHQYFLQWPRPAQTAEQALGRLHRHGQEADELVAVTNISSTFDERNRAATINDALYAHQCMGSRQKLIYCNWDPVPGVCSYEALREMGLQVKQLDQEHKKMAREIFSSDQ